MGIAIMIDKYYMINITMVIEYDSKYCNCGIKEVNNKQSFT